MGKIFNVSADCQPELHYMVDISERLQKIKEMVDAGQYFTINRARQYGKTTTLQALGEYLKNQYMIVSMDFQMMSASKFKDENSFSIAFAREFIESIENEEGMTKLKSVCVMKKMLCEERQSLELFELFKCLSAICAESSKAVVLMIDEVDSASNNQVFLDFLAQLRGYYIKRKKVATFQSVILAGVYDIKNIKRKLHDNQEYKRNSPWNIAADFLVDMSFSQTDIAGMLNDYENDHRTGMNVEMISQLIYDYTSGYPFLVSRICKFIDERVAGSQEFPDRISAWSYPGFLEAIKMVLAEKNTLFESMINKLYDYPELKEIIYTLLFTGREIAYNPLNYVTEIAEMFGFIKNNKGTVAISNRIFETVFYNFFLTSAEVQSSDIYKEALKDRNMFICHGSLNMELLLKKFVEHFDDLYGDQPDSFKEEDGRRYFLLYLRPIINGTGNYYIEARTRNMERTDVIIDYRGEQYIVELKIWHGNAYNERGEEQLKEYLEHYHLKKGYMLSFNFNKNKKIGIRRLVFGDKTLIEAIV